MIFNIVPNQVIQNEIRLPADVVTHIEQHSREHVQIQLNNMTQWQYQHHQAQQLT